MKIFYQKYSDILRTVTLDQFYYLSGPFIGNLLMKKMKHYWILEQVKKSNLSISYSGNIDAGDKRISDKHLKAFVESGCVIISLYAMDNQNITTVKPFAETLEELDACKECGIDDAGLTNFIKLKKLNSWGNRKITIVIP